MKDTRTMIKLALLGAAPVLLAGAPRAAWAATYKWTGAVSSDWHSAGNWAPRGVPGPADSATIDSQVVQVRRDAVVGSLSLGPQAELKNGGRLTVRRSTVSKGLVVGLGSVNIPAGASATFSISPATVAAALARRGATPGSKSGKGAAIAFQPIRNKGVLRASVGTTAQLSFDSIENTGTTAIVAAGRVSFKSIKNTGTIHLTVSKSKPAQAAAPLALGRGLSCQTQIIRADADAPIVLGDVVNAATGTVSLSGAPGAGTDFLANTFDNHGQLVFDDASTIVSSGLQNAAGGVLTLDGSTQIVPEPGHSPALENLGTVHKAGGEQASVSMEWVNNGLVSIDAGTLLLQAPAGTDVVQQTGTTTLNGGTLQVLAADSTPGTLDLQGGVLNGIGTIEGNVQNSGSINAGFSPGTITINGNFTQTNNGTLNMEIGGGYAGSGYDQLIVNGRASLAGAITMLKYGSYVPAVNASFQLLKFWSFTGGFTRRNLVTPVATYDLTMTTTVCIARCISRSGSTASSEMRPADRAGRLALAADARR